MAESNSGSGTRHPRPLSPHISIYRPQITSVLSITHRFTGMILVFGAVLVTYWLTSATYGAETFNTAQAVLGSWFGRIVLFGVVFSLWYHFANGIRHLGWDIGWGFALDRMRQTGWAVVIFAVVMTLVTFMAAYAAGGA